MKFYRSSLVSLSLGLMIGLSVADDGNASTNGFVVPTFRGLPDTESGYWESFAVPHGDPGNPADQSDAVTSAVLTQTDTNAFLTGSGNIYNLGTSSFALVDRPPFQVATVVLQTRTAGGELDYGTVVLLADTDKGEQVVPPLFRYELDRVVGQGSNVSSLWQWDLSGLNVEGYRIEFHAAGPSLSFDALTLDVAKRFGTAFAGQPFGGSTMPATLARWMYPFNGDPAGRSTASVFGALGSSPDFDSRDAQYLLGWTTTNQVPAGLGAHRYLLRRVRVTLTVSSGNQYIYTGTLPDYRSYFPTNDPRHLPAAMASSPVELFGAGFRAGYTSTSFPQDAPWAVNPDGGFYTNRSAYAAGYDTHGILVDVSNNVGDDGTHEIAGAFEVAPFAVGRSTEISPGQLMPTGSRLVFDLNLKDPLIYEYVRQGLHEGNLGFVVSCLVGASRTGAPTYPSFYTIFSPLAAPDQYPLLELEGAILRTQVDSDEDDLPDDWENFLFGSLAPRAIDDADGDGAHHRFEYEAGTNPNDAADLFRILSVSKHGDAPVLSFSFAAGRETAVQWTEDWSTWQTIDNPTIRYGSDWLNKATSNPSYPSPVYAEWTDTNAAPTARFYRLLTP